METNYKSFSVEAIKFPMLFFKWNENAAIDGDFMQFFMARFKILSDDTVKITFGMQVLPASESGKEHPACLGIVEAEALVRLEGKIGKPPSKAEIPLLPNMLAYIYPFLREKIYSGFAVNSLNVFVPSMNFYSFVDEVLDKLEILDERAAI